MLEDFIRKYRVELESEEEFNGKTLSELLAALPFPEEATAIEICAQLLKMAQGVASEQIKFIVKIDPRFQITFCNLFYYLGCKEARYFLT